MVLETDERVFLRYPLETDRDEFLILRAASLAFFRPWATKIPQDMDDLYGPASFDEYLESAQDKRIQQLLVCSAEKNRILGTFKLRNITRGNEQYAIISMWVGAPYAGSGCMRHGLRLLLRHAFMRLRLHRIEANVLPTNLPSVTLLRRTGFEKEGVSIKYCRIDGEWRDLDRYVLFVEEWEEARLSGSGRGPG